MSVAYGEQQRNSSALSASGAGGQRELERQYHVVLQDSLGHPALGFREGTWFRLTVSGPQPLQLRGAIRTCPHAAGSIVQIACWWMRENPMQPRSLDLATELALTVGELVRVCPADGLGTTSMDLLPMAMAAVAQSGPPVAPAPALPSGSSGYAASSAGSSAFGSTPALGSSSSSVGSSDAFGSGSAFGSGAYGSGSGTYVSSSDGLYGSASSASGSSSNTAMTQTGQILVMVRHPHLDRVAVGTRVHDPPHRVGDLLGRLRGRPRAHLIDQRELQPLDLLLRRALAKTRERSTAQVLVPGAFDHGETVAELDRIRHEGRECTPEVLGPMAGDAGRVCA